MELVGRAMELEEACVLIIAGIPNFLTVRKYFDHL